jgi:hypothetical protein
LASALRLRSWGGTSGAWNFQYNSGAPADLYLQKITIDLSNTDLRFDTWPGGFGSLASLDIGGFGGTDAATGLVPSYVSGSALDGGAFVTFDFTNFLPGMVFYFTADVDHPDPTLLPLQNCTGLGPIALAICNSQNAIRTGTNNLLLTGAEWVGPNGISGATVSFQFGGTGYQTRTVTGTFGTVTLADIIRGLIDGEGGGAFSNDASVETPEPATFVLFGVGLTAVGLVRRLRRRQ